MATAMTKWAKERGLEIVDATQSLHIDLKPHDIKMGTRKKAKECAFACAAKRIDRTIKHAFFYRSTAWLEKDDGKLVRYMLPTSVQREIISFDRGGGMMPGEYLMKPPAKSQSLDAVKVYSAKTAAHRGRKTKTKGIVRHYTGGIRSIRDLTA